MWLAGNWMSATRRDRCLKYNLYLTKESLHRTLTPKHASRAALTSHNHSLSKSMHSESRTYCFAISLALSPARRFRSIFDHSSLRLRSLYFGSRKFAVLDHRANPKKRALKLLLNPGKSCFRVWLGTVQMNEENRPLVADELVHLTNTPPVEIQDLRKINPHSKGNLWNNPHIIKVLSEKSIHVTGWKHLDLDRFMPKILPGYSSSTFISCSLQDCCNQQWLKKINSRWKAEWPSF